MSFIVFLLIINVLVIVHEFGHFLFAKLFGVKVYEFAIGIGPALFKKEYKGTIFSIRLIPFGGFNDIKGQEKREKGKGNFVDLNWGRKMLILLGGVIFNILLAIMILYVYLGFKGFEEELPMQLPSLFAQEQVVKKPGVIVANVEKDSGLKVYFDKNGPFVIYMIACRRVNSVDDFIKTLKEYIKSNSDNTIPLLVGDITDPDKHEKLFVKLREDKTLGVVIVPNEKYIWHYDQNIQSKLLSGVSFSVDLIYANVKLLSGLIKYVVTTHDYKPAEYAVSGPVGIYKVIDSGVQAGASFGYFMYLTALLSLSLAVFNLIPFPGLDGWHILIVTLFAVSRGKIYSEKWYKYISIAGLILLLLFSIIITYKDIRLFFF